MPEYRLEALDRFDDLVDSRIPIFGRRIDVQGNGKGIDSCELLEQQGLAFHDRQRGFRANVAETQHRGAVGDNGNGVCLDRQLAHLRRVLGNSAAHSGNAWRVGHGQFVTSAQSDLRDHLDLAALVHLQRGIDDVDNLDAIQLAGGQANLLHMRIVDGIDGDVTGHELVGRLDNVERTERAACFTDRSGETAECPGNVLQLHSHADRISGIGYRHGKSS
jgi:hypothetical protein